MVPHHKILQAISLIALCRADGIGAVAKFCAEARVTFPVTLGEFLHTRVFPELPPGLEAWLRSTDAGLLRDYRPLMEAASRLEVGNIVGVGPEGAMLVLPGLLPKWRQDDTLRVFIETLLLAGIPAATVAGDVQRMWGYPVDETAIALFARLFADREYTEGEYWSNYLRCIAPSEGTLKRDLMQQPHEYVRWRMGVPVEMSNEKVLDRLISDAYFTERLLKAEAGGQGLRLSKDEIVRLKLERDTLFKALNAKQKLKMAESAGGGGDDAEARKVVETLKAIGLQYEEQNPMMLDDLDGLCSG
jgi:hypothetical protein